MVGWGPGREDRSPPTPPDVMLLPAPRTVRHCHRTSPPAVPARTHSRSIDVLLTLTQRWQSQAPSARRRVRLQRMFGLQAVRSARPELCVAVKFREVLPHREFPPTRSVPAAAREIGLSNAPTGDSQTPWSRTHSCPVTVRRTIRTSPRPSLPPLTSAFHSQHVPRDRGCSDEGDRPVINKFVTPGNLPELAASDRARRQSNRGVHVARQAIVKPRCSRRAKLHEKVFADVRVSLLVARPLRKGRCRSAAHRCHQFPHGTSSSDWSHRAGPALSHGRTQALGSDPT